MALARWKDLCIDATRPAEVGRFWADALDLDASPLDDGDWVLRGVRPEQTVWVNEVAEPKTVKNRVHLDLVRRSTTPLVALGGHVLREVMDGGESWVVVDDPDGAELCIFDTAQGEPSALVVDSVDPAAQAVWWADVLHAEVVPGPDGVPRWLTGVSGLPFEVWKFVAVPDPKSVKNRVHWDLAGVDVDGFVERGATVLRRPGADADWHVLADREGNEFCLFAPAAAS